MKELEVHQQACDLYSPSQDIVHPGFGINDVFVFNSLLRHLLISTKISINFASCFYFFFFFAFYYIEG